MSEKRPSSRSGDDVKAQDTALTEEERRDLEAGHADIAAGRTHSNSEIKRWVRARAAEVRRYVG